MQNMSKDELGTFSQKMQLNIVLLGPDHLEFISYWVDSSKCLTLLNNVETFIKSRKIFGIVPRFRRIHPLKDY